MHSHVYGSQGHGDAMFQWLFGNLVLNVEQERPIAFERESIGIDTLESFDERGLAMDVHGVAVV
jgi:hypothetical protein